MSPREVERTGDGRPVRAPAGRRHDLRDRPAGVGRIGGGGGA